MKKLEKKIIRNVYVNETRRTLSEAIVGIILVGASLGAAVFVGSLLAMTFDEKGTYEVFGIFHEDFDVVRTYFSEAVRIIYQDIPKSIFLAFLVIVFLFIFFVIIVLKNSSRIQKRLNSIYRYWIGK